MWRWGSPRNHGAGVDSDQQLFFQHDPTWVPGERPGEADAPLGPGQIQRSSSAAS